MNSLRPELLELTPQALTALSNAGFVKRSLKELENGNVPEISHENGALIATFSDGVRTQLANGQALKEAQCSCGASGMWPSSRDAGVKLSTTLCYRPAYGKRRGMGIRQSGWKNWLPFPMPPANAHRRWSLKASPLSCSVRRVKFPLPAYR
ncbi:zinc finger SWIM domain-containing protein [Escherichia coli]|uniref:Zinc finger SWIM domain-containing protein n=1 Tax=Escherichia coli TaxID=562 RepID=A0A377DRI0_ECOLX|nr:zinc finger SWIM domain-containing protein [Escherichia coli]